MSDAARIARLERELDRSREDLRIANERHSRELSLTNERHHRERMAMINSIGERVDTLLTRHDETITAIQQLDERLTVPPSRDLEHGYALLVERADDENQYVIKFIAGQRKYVTNQLRKMNGEVWEPFRETGNPIDLRNRFRQAAARKMREKRLHVSTVSLNVIIPLNILLLG